MGWFSDDSDQANAYNEVTNAPHKATLSHELIAAAASYEAAKAYENHVAENGQPTSHAKAKEILAGFAGAFVDREAETKGLDYIDREKAKHHATNSSMMLPTTTITKS
ncbi:CipC1 protein, concanamycin induced protein C [Laccaria bicolor S238N-H82]